MRRDLILSSIVCLLCYAVSATHAAPADEKGKAEAAKPAAEKPDAKTAKKPAPKRPAAKKVSVAQFTIKGDYPEGPRSEGLFGDMQPSLAAMIKRLDAAAADDDVAALWLQIEPLAMGRGKIHELQAAIARVREAGKPVYAEMSSATTPQYLLAAGCDEIVMPTSGMLILPGVRAEVTFYKGLLDKLGLKFDMLQMGKYKGAAEPMTRTEMSEPLRESMEAIVDDAYENLAGMIAAGRSMKEYRVKTLIDEGLFTAASAQKAGLIDRIAYTDQFQEALRKELGADELNVVADYKKKKVETIELSGLGGMMKLMEMVLGGKPSETTSKAKKIAVVYAVGAIVEGKSTSDLFGSSSVGSTSLVKALRKAADDETVAAIVLRIDSPGGSAVASDLIWRETIRIEKPLIASMGDVAGSGGYYIAMGCDQILAAPGTVTGSIGVIGGKLVLGGLYDKVGLNTEVISRGRLSGSLSSTEPFTDDERAAWMAVLKSTYQQFVNKAAAGREMNPRELGRLAQGRVYTGRMAVENGLIDDTGTLRDAIAAAKEAAGLKKDEKVELLILPRAKTLFEQLFSDGSASMQLKDVAPELLRHARKAALLRRLLTEPTLMWMPYEVELR